MLVPPTTSTSIPCSASARNIPMCAKPRAPPPPSTTPIARPPMRRASRSTSRSFDGRTWWCAATSRGASHRAVCAGRAQSSRCRSTSSRRAASPIAAIARSVSPGAGSSEAFATTSTRSAWRRQRRVHGVQPGSASSTTWRCPRSSADSHETIDAWEASPSAACAAPGRPIARSTSVLETRTALPSRARADVNRSASLPRGTPGPAATSAIVIGAEPPRAGRCDERRSRMAAARASCIIACG